MGETAVALALVILLLLVIAVAVWRKKKGKGSEGFTGGLLGSPTDPALRAVRKSIDQIQKYAAFTDLDTEFSDDGPYGRTAAQKVRQANQSAKVVLTSTGRLGKVLDQNPSPAKLRGLASSLRGTSELFRAAGAGLSGAGRDLRKMAALAPDLADPDTTRALDRSGQKFEDIGSGIYQLDASLRRLCDAAE